MSAILRTVPGGIAMNGKRKRKALKVYRQYEHRPAVFLLAVLVTGFACLLASVLTAPIF
jgi:hypothetical protein